VNDIVGGCRYYCLETGDECLVLISSNGLLTKLSLLSKVDASSPSSVGKLKHRFAQDDGVGIVEADSSVFIIVSHCDGSLERTKIFTK
jgi:hypothetical protein